MGLVSQTVNGAAITGDEGPDALGMFLGYRLKTAFNAFHANLVATLDPFDLRMITYSALVVVNETPGLRQSEIANLLGIDRGNVVAIVDELEHKGLVVRNQHPDDRRSYALHPTEEGQRVCRAAIAADKECETRILAGFDSEKIRQLFDELKAIEKAADAQFAMRSD